MFFSLWHTPYAQNSFVYDSDTILRKSDIKLSEEFVLSGLKKQKCFKENHNYEMLLCYNLNLTNVMNKEDFLSKKFMAYLEPMYQYLDKKYLSKEDKKKYKNFPGLLKLLQVDDGIIYDSSRPIATTDIKWVYCHTSNEQYYTDLLSKTKEYRISWWFRFQISDSGEKFIGIIGMDEQSNLWAVHITKGGILPLNEFIDRYWGDWMNLLNKSHTTILRK